MRYRRQTNHPTLQVPGWKWPTLRCKESEAKLIAVEMPIFRCRCLKNGTGISRKPVLYYLDNTCKDVEVFEETTTRLNAYHLESDWIKWELNYLGLTLEEKSNGNGTQL